LDPISRDDYLKEISKGDISLRIQVTRLLEADRYTEKFLEEPCVAVVGIRIKDDSLASAFQPGEIVSGRFNIIRLIGTGGMGEVYRAQDLRLHREVAVKVLLAAVATNPERLRRFEQEAHSLAALNHPNILAVYDVGAVDETSYLVSEFLEGETLRAAMDNGLLSVKHATEYAQGIANGLAAGHSKGIVHRDIKPENIFLTIEGRVKILDFGLAKLVAAGSPNDLETLLTGAGTSSGAVLGTVGYMSPEQVRGEPAETTSDIFSFGAVLYEMLSGNRAFKRDTAAETMAAIVREEPPPLTREISTGRIVPSALQRIVERCLEKNQRRRFQSASDLAFAIESLNASVVASGNSHSGIEQNNAKAVADLPATKTRVWLWPAVALALGALSFEGWWFGNKSPQHPPPSYTQITFQRGYIPMARFLQAGETVIYGGQFESDPMTMYSVNTKVKLPAPIDVPSAMLYSVSSSGQMAIGTDSGTNDDAGTLSEVPVTGGTPRPLQRRVTSADYAPNGRTMAISRFQAAKCVVEFPAGHKVYETDGYVDYLRVSPDGKWVAFDDHPLFGDDKGYVSVVDSDSRVKKLVADYGSLRGVAWKTTNEVWYTSVRGNQSVLHGVTLDGKDRSILSAPRPMRILDIAPDGRLLLRFDERENTIETMGPDGKVHPHQELFNSTSPIALSNDGTMLAFVEYSGSEFSASEETFYLTGYRKTDGSPPVVLGKGAALGQAFSPDGETIAAWIDATPGKFVLYPLGAGESRTFDLGNLTKVNGVSWFPGGKQLAFVATAPGRSPRSYELDLINGLVKPLGPESPVFLTLISPDGKHAIARTPNGPLVYEFATGQAQPVRGLESTEQIDRWTTDGTGLIVMNGIYGVEQGLLKVSRLNPLTGKRTLVRQMEVRERAGLALARIFTTDDGKAYAYGYRAIHSTLWIVDGVK
jgi:serine/threonine protein kinase/WD40 repeat protein